MYSPERVNADPDSRYVFALKELPYIKYLLHLLINDKFDFKRDSGDLIRYLDKAADVMSSGDAPKL